MMLTKVMPSVAAFLNEVFNATKTLHANPHNTQHLVALSLHASVLEHARGIATLLERGDVTCPFILLRSLLEAVVDLVNLAADPQYESVILCNSLKEQRRVLTNATRTAAAPNRYFADFTQRPEQARRRLSDIEVQLQELAARGIRPLTIEKRFRRANRPDLYEGPYAYLCSHAHNDLGVLQERHLRPTPAGVTIAFFSRPNDDDVHLLLATTAELVSQAFDSLYSLLGGIHTGADMHNVRRAFDAFMSALSSADLKRN